MNNDFMTNLKSVLDEEYNVSITENGAVGYRTTGKELLDINFSISSLRNMSEKQIMSKFEAAFLENRLYAIKWLFYAGDVRCGVGERRLFRIGMKYLANTYPEVVKAVLYLVPFYTRWDNLLPLLDTSLKCEVLLFIENQLKEDLDNYNNGNNISLLAKWLPSLNASSSETKRYARIICNTLKLTDRKYRKMLSILRSYLKVVEVSMSINEWGNIDYSTIPSKANLNYKNAFMRHDKDRRTKYLESLSRGETKINADVLFPHVIVHKYGMYGYMQDTTIEELWKALPDYVQNTGNTICVSDGSGSMTRRIDKHSTESCLDVAVSLAIYFAERSSGQFKDKFITFSSRPQLVDLSYGKTLREKINIAGRYTEVDDTNIEAVFDLILTTAIQNKMTQDEIPQNILILSDMEFNDCATTNGDMSLSTKLFKVIEEKYSNAGYKLPRLIFWNINSRTGTIPVKENELGVALVSGYSPAVMKMVLSNKLDPYECLIDQINSTRYDSVQKAIENVLK